MADAQKKSSTANSKEKDSLFDMDIGNEFLGSWKPKSAPAADDDGLNFDMPPVSKGNKKSFMDMDFNLDDDFGKMPSFNFDMPDFDISPPLKKDGNSKDKMEENSSDKGDLKFTSFDMDMSEFDLSPPLKKDGKSEENSKEPSKQKDKGKEYSSAGMKFSSFDMDMSDFDISPPLKKDGKSEEKSKEPSKQNDKEKDPFGLAFDFDGLENFKFEPSLGKKGSCKDKNDMESWDDFDFDPSSTKEVSKGQKDKDSTESLENLNSEPRLVEGGLKAQKDKDSSPSPENLNVKPSSAKEGSKSQKHTDAECLKKLNFETGLATEGSKTRNDKDVTKGPVKFSSQRSSAKEGPEPHKYQENTEIPVHESGCQSMEASGRGNLIGHMSTMKDPKKPSSLGTTSAFDRDGQVGGSADVESTRANFPSELAIDKPVTACSISSEEVPPETLIVSTEPPKATQPDKCLSLDTFDCETSLGNDANMSNNPISDNFHHGCNSASEASERNDGNGRSSTCLVEGKNINETSEAGFTCSYKRTMSKTSPHFPTVVISERDINEKSHAESHVKLNKEKTDVGKSNVQASGISVTTSDKSTNRENQEHASEIPKLGVVRNQESNQSDKVLPSVNTHHSKMLFSIDLPQTESRESGKGLASVKVPDNVGAQQKKNSNVSFTPALDLLKEKPALRQTGTSLKGLDTTISSSVAQPRLRMEINKKTAQTSKVPLTLASLPAVKRTSTESKRTPELCGLKLSTLNLDSAKSLSQAGMTSVEITRQRSGIVRNTPKSSVPYNGSQKRTPSPLSLNQNCLLLKKTPKDAVPHDGSRKQTPSHISLKRKTLEECSADKFVLYPSKRISQSPTLSRNFMDTSKRAYDKNEDNSIKSALGTCKVSAADILHKVNSRALEMSVYIENDRNIKQAAAYTKELDDICDMLRMKQEAAKELMVRATVNRNKMLMVNYPHLEQKISMVNSFAASSLKRVACL